MSALNWANWIAACIGGLMVGVLVLIIGMWIDRRREDKRLGRELAEFEKEFPTDGA